MSKLNIDLNTKCSGAALDATKLSGKLAMEDNGAAAYVVNEVSNDAELKQSMVASEAPLKVIKLRWYRKCLFALGGAPYQMLSNVIGFFITYYLLNVAQLPAFLSSIIVISGRICDALTDPLVGMLVEKSSPVRRIGRLKFWILCAMPFTCAVYCLFWYVPSSFHIPISEATSFQMFTRFSYYFVLMFVLQTLFTCHQVPFSSLTMYISNCKKVRDSATAFRMSFEMLGVLVGIGAATVLIKTNDYSAMPTTAINSSACCNYSSLETVYNVNTSDSDGWMASSIAISNLSNRNSSTLASAKYTDQEVRDSFLTTAGVLVSIYVVCVCCVMFGVKEHLSIKVKKESREPFLKSLQRALSFRPYVILMFAFLQIALVMQNVQANLVMYVTYTLGQTKAVLGFGMLVLLGSGIVCVPMWQCVQRKWGKRQAFAGGLFSILPALFGLLFIPTSVLSCKYVFYAMCALSGASVSVAYLCPWSMLPDVLDAYFLEKGVRQTSVFYSFYVFFSKLAVGIAVGASQLVLGLVGFQNGKSASEQPPEVAQALRYLISVPSLVAAFGSLVCVYFYPITEDVRKEHEAKLRLIRQFEDEDGSQSNSTDSTPVYSDSPPSSIEWTPDSKSDVKLLYPVDAKSLDKTTTDHSVTIN